MQIVGSVEGKGPSEILLSRLQERLSKSGLEVGSEVSPRGVIGTTQNSSKTSFWSGKRVLVAGGAGFIGCHLTEYLLNEGADLVILDNMENGSKLSLPSSVNLIEEDAMRLDVCEDACKRVHVVINAAARVAGVGYNSKHHGEMFYRNAQLNLNMLEAARKREVEKYVVVSSACIYERAPPIPTPESHGFVGDPEPTNFGYGWAKRLAEIQARTYVEEYGMRIAVVRPYNTYGPGDHFQSTQGHVIPTLIRKVFSGTDEISVWGDGSQRRSFVYVSDLVRGLASAAEHSGDADPINIGSNSEVSIAQLIQTIISISGKGIKVRFDASKPSGQPRRLPDLQKAKDILGFSAEVEIEDGLQKTIRWYEANYNNREQIANPTIAR